MDAVKELKAIYLFRDLPEGALRKVAQAEEESFRRTIDKGLLILEEEVARLASRYAASPAELARAVARRARFSGIAARQAASFCSVAGASPMSVDWS